MGNSFDSGSDQLALMKQPLQGRCRVTLAVSGADAASASRLRAIATAFADSE